MTETVLRRTFRSNLLGELVRYAMVGVGTAVVYIGTLLALVEGVGLSPGVGAAFSYGAAMLFNYVSQKLFTFRNRSSHAGASLRYCAVVATLLVINTAGMSLLPGLTGIPYLQVQAGLAVLILALSFLAQKFWIFANR